MYDQKQFIRDPTQAQVYVKVCLLQSLALTRVIDKPNAKEGIVDELEAHFFRMALF